MADKRRAECVTSMAIVMNSMSKTKVIGYHPVLDRSKTQLRDPIHKRKHTDLTAHENPAGKPFDALLKTFKVLPSCSSPQRGRVIDQGHDVNFESSH